jgi:hypothetical protein
MTQITRDTLKDTQRQLKASCEELKELQGILATGDGSVLDRHALVIEQIRELQKSYVEQRDALSITLGSGRLWSSQYEALERFAGNNNLAVTWLLSRITVESGVVVECNFSSRGLTTLKGLDRLGTICKLNINRNPQLASLEGIPTRAIEKLWARECGLAGDLSELRGADKLKWLNVEENAGLISLHGIPLQSIEEIRAERCALSGDHTFLANAQHLRFLHLKNNSGVFKSVINSSIFTWLTAGRLTLDAKQFNSAVRIVL